MERFHRLAHSVWDCKYHMVWIPKYRRKKLYGTRRQIVIDTIKQWSRIKGIEIIEGHAMSDHIHSRSPSGPKKPVRTKNIIKIDKPAVIFFMTFPPY